MGGILKPGWVQHTTVGRGMWHAEINNRKTGPLRFIQMWFIPAVRGSEPKVEQKEVEPAARTNRFLPLVSNVHPGALPILSDARVFSCLLQPGKTLGHPLEESRGAYLYVLEGGPVKVNGRLLPDLAAAKIWEEPGFSVTAQEEAELLLVDVLLI